MKYLDEFLDYLKYQKNYSKYTIINYKDDILEFLSFIKREHVGVLDVDYPVIRLYLEDLDKNNYKASSISRKISALRSFYKYLSRNDVISSNPFLYVSLPKKEKKLPKFLYYNELEEMFNVCDLSDSFGMRDRLILEMLYATGVRISELVNVKLVDIDKSLMRIKVLGKGNKERFVNFGEYALDILNLYLNDGRLSLLKNKKSDYLFINNKGGQLSARGVRDILNKIISKTSVKTHISPHVLRHTFATHLLNEGCDITSVQEMLGHESLRATQIYTHVTNDRLKDIYLKAHPRGSKKDDV